MKCMPTSEVEQRAEGTDLLSLEVEVVAVLGRAKVGAAEWRSLRPGDVVLLNQKIEKPVSLSVSGRTWGEGKPVVSAGRKAVVVKAKVQDE